MKKIVITTKDIVFNTFTPQACLLQNRICSPKLLPNFNIPRNGRDMGVMVQIISLCLKFTQIFL